MNYQNKYLKYKNKYLELKQKGGVECSIVHFIQHKGECWHDSLLTIFFFSDVIGDRIQKIIKSKKNDYFLSKLEHEFLLPMNIDNYDEFECYIDLFKIYISNIIDRFKNKIDQEDDLPDQSRLLLKREISSTCSITSTITIKNIINIKEETKLLTELDEHLGSSLSALMTIQTINYFFQQDNYFINSIIINNNLLVKNSTNKLTQELLDKTNAIYISVSSSKNISHVVCFFRCNDQCMYYDDNGLDDNKINVRNVAIFDWYTFIKKYIELSKEDSLMKDLLNEIKKLYTKEYFNNFLIIGYLIFIYEDTFSDKLDYYKKSIPNFIELYSYYKNNLLYNRLYSKEIVLTIVTNNGLKLSNIPKELMIDKDILLAAVTNNGFALQFVPKELQNKEIVLAALTNNKKAKIHALNFILDKDVQTILLK
jgi:hypothetical protein